MPTPISKILINIKKYKYILYIKIVLVYYVKKKLFGEIKHLISHEMMKRYIDLIF